MAKKTGTTHLTEVPPEGQAGPPTRRRRRWLVRAGVVGLVILALVVLPGYVASTPLQIRRFPDLRVRYDTWATSTHAGAGCADCHARPGVWAQAAYRARTVGALYLSLVMPSRQPAVYDTPANEACLACHSDLRTVSPTGDLKIPHRAHVEVLKMRCVQCHAYVVHEKSPEGKHTPPMAGCLTCHDGDKAKNSCPTCHTQKDAPASHTAKDWLVVHGPASVGGDCSKCHGWAPHWCADCHSQRPRSHGADWRAVHGRGLAQHRGCEACHAAPFCIRCHGTVPKIGFDPALKLVQ